MKRLKFYRAIVAIAMMLIGWLPSLAHDFEVDGVFYYKTSYNTVAVTYKGSFNSSYSNEYEGNVVIPSSVKYNGVTYSVTSIGNSAFSSCTSLTSIEIPNSVTSIEWMAFHNCLSLTSIEIGNSVTSIGGSAFGQCHSMTSIEIPNSVTSIGECAFAGCSSLTSIEIPNSVTSIGIDAFIDTSLSSVVWNAIQCEDLNSCPFPDRILSFKFGDEVEYIPSQLCRNLSYLPNIEIPNTVTALGEFVFNKNRSIGQNSW